jgi:hypothetical protein
VITQHPDSASQKFAIYILGAGFSCPAGLPSGPDLWQEVRRRALSLSGRAKHFSHDLATYIEYRKRCFGDETVDFEEFMAFLDIEFYLGLRGKETWSADGNESQVVVKTLIGEILSERTPEKHDIPDLYLKFAQILKPNDRVLTFNYDVLLERALEKAGVPFRLFPDRYKPNPSGKGLLVDMDKEEVVLLKPHGSIDWFDRTSYSQEFAGQDDLSRRWNHPIFGKPEELGAAPLVEGARFPDDPLRHMYRVRDVNRLYKRRILFEATPSLFNPSSMKIIYSQMVRDFWWDMGQAGVFNFALAIIGFSLPRQDEYARQIIYRLVRNYQDVRQHEGLSEHKKGPVVLIDLRKTAKAQQEFRSNYSFVNWSTAQICFDGFDENALALLSNA